MAWLEVGRGFGLEFCKGGVLTRGEGRGGRGEEGSRPWSGCFAVLDAEACHAMEYHAVLADCCGRGIRVAC